MCHFCQNHTTSRSILEFVVVGHASDAVDSVQSVKVMKPGLPILSRIDLNIPFITSGELIEHNHDRG